LLVFEVDFNILVSIRKIDLFGVSRDTDEIDEG
jgi:hypothetical protein